MGKITIITNFVNKRLETANEIDDLSISNIYILNNSIVKKYGQNNYNISGEIENAGFELKSKDLTLMVNPNSTELNCTIALITGNNYTINCPTNDDIDYDFQNACSDIDGDMLLVNVKDSNDNNDEDSSQEPIKINNSYRVRPKKSNGLNAGGIVAIILGSVGALGGLIAALFIGRKGDNPTNQVRYIETSNEKMKI